MSQEKTGSMKGTPNRSNVYGMTHERRRESLVIKGMGDEMFFKQGLDWILKYYCWIGFGLKKHKSVHLRHIYDHFKLILKPYVRNWNTLCGKQSCPYR